MGTVAAGAGTPALSARVRIARPGTSSLFFVLDVAVEAPPGITILFGPSGAGKSTLLDCIAGVLRPDEGCVAVGGDVLFDSQRKINLRPNTRGVAYVFQSLALFPHLTAAENVAYGLAALPRHERQSRAEEIMKAFGVDMFRTRKPAEVSGGERQRIALARSLATRPRVLLLDEPLTGLDAHLKAAILDDLRAWNAAHRIPILYVTHSREEVSALGERVVAIDYGRVVSEGTPIEVLDAPRRKRIAQAAGFENLLNGSVVDVREADGVMRVRLDGGQREIEVPLGFSAVGHRVCVAVRAGDILLATQPPQGLSARNVMEGKICALEPRGSLTQLRVDCGTPFLVHVTPSAVRALELAPGQRVWLVLKTHSCHLVES